MKLIAHDNRHEGQILRDDALIVFGRNVEHTGKVNGWYVAFNAPFIRKTVDRYIDPCSWEPRPAHCWMRIMLSCRVIIDRSWYTLDVHVGWTEILNKEEE